MPPDEPITFRETWSSTSYQLEYMSETTGWQWITATSATTTYSNGVNAHVNGRRIKLADVADRCERCERCAGPIKGRPVHRFGATICQRCCARLVRGVHHLKRSRVRNR